MTELLNTVASWPSLLLVVVVFGFAPGFCLRLLVCAYPRSDPRRTELIAELYTVPRIQRPLWVAEQLETALFEGLPHRLAAVSQRVARQRQARAKARLWAWLVANFVATLGLAAYLGPLYAVFGLVTSGLIVGSSVTRESRRWAWLVVYFVATLGLTASLGPPVYAAFGLVTSGLVVGSSVMSRWWRAYEPSRRR